MRGLTPMFLITLPIAGRLANCTKEPANHFIHPPWRILKSVTLRK